MAEGTGRLVVVMPVYNEGENIRVALGLLDEKLKAPAETWLVYDSEEDSTVAAVAGLKTRVPFRLVRNKYGRGALGAIRTGLEDATSKWVAVTMADLSDPPEVIDAMLEAGEREDADIVCASRYMKGGRQIGGPKFKGFLSHFAGVLLRGLAGLETHDPTNSFKLYRKRFLETVSIESTGGFEIGLELVVKAHRAGRKIVEVPTTWRDRSSGKSNFKLWKWLPHYLHWFWLAFRRETRSSGLAR